MSLVLQLPYNCPLTSISTGFTKNFRYLNIEVLNLVRLFWGRVFPYISRIHTAYIGEDSSILGTWNVWWWLVNYPKTRNPETKPVASLLPLKINAWSQWNSIPFWDHPAYFHGGTVSFRKAIIFCALLRCQVVLKPSFSTGTNPRDDFFIIEMKPVAGCNGFVRFVHVSGACLAMEVWPKCSILGAYLPTFGLNLW